MNADPDGHPYGGLLGTVSVGTLEPGYSIKKQIQWYPPLLDWAIIKVNLGQPLYEKWMANGSKGSNIVPIPGEYSLNITGTSATITDLPLDVSDERNIRITFCKSKEKNPLQDYSYNYIIIFTKDGSTVPSLGYHLTINVLKPEHLLALITDSTYTSCAGSCDAAATVTAYGGTPPYTYQWGLETGSQTTPIATGLCEGRYSVRVTDLEDSIFVTSVNIIADPALFNYTGETTLTANTSWNNVNYTIKDKIIVPADITLNITGSVIGFGSFGGIWVEKGGKLIVDSSTLIGLAGCGNMWRGITVVGDHGIPQPSSDPLLTGYPHGFAWFKNNSLLKDAETGIFVGDPFYRDTRIGSGGILWVESGSKLKNCRRDVEFKTYSYENRSRFDNCEFICDAALAHPVYAGMGTQFFVRSWGANNLLFNKVKFINTGPFELMPKEPDSIL
ncbi:MAG: SprB repeat-containing protein [Bacteroidia bacterium]|nr:SprB repeat-containing protein [Bacteroidia bacterium]